MIYKVLVVSGDYSHKDDLQAACLSRNIVMDYTKSMTEAIEMLEKADYCLAIIRSDMIDDEESIKIMRQMKKIPALLLSYIKPGDKISVLQNGSHVFVITPYSINYLAEKCTALAKYYSRRKVTAVHALPTILAYGHLIMLAETHQVFLRGEKITLTKKEFDLLKYFMTNIGLVLTYEQIYNYVWKNDNSYNSHDIVHSLIRRLRHKLKGKSDSDDYITVVWGTGYKFGA